MKNSNIEWTDHTFNPWTGCAKVSPGCANCYAESWAKRSGIVKWNGPRRRTSASNWNQPHKWDREACAGPLPGDDPLRRPRVFCASLADWLDNEVPIEWLADLLALIHQTPNLDWLLLTKRPQNWLPRLEEVTHFAMFSKAHHALLPFLARWHPAHDSAGGVTGSPIPPANVWIGTTVEDQTRADERIPHLLRIPARVRFLSCEPLLGHVDLAIGDPKHRTAESYHAEIHWVIAGGESGPGARPMHPEWARSLRDQCAAAGVAFHFKQWGEWEPGEIAPNGATYYISAATGKILQYTSRSMRSPERVNFGTHSDPYSGPITAQRVGKKSAGRLLDGIEHNAFPPSA
jgi:protein gp37